MLKKLLKHFERSPDPLNIFPEIAAARALFTDFINRYKEMQGAILAWHESWQAAYKPLPEALVLAFSGVVDEFEITIRESGDELTAKQKEDVAQARAFLELTSKDRLIQGRPRVLLDISDAYRLLDTISKMVERVEKVRAENAISRQQLRSVLEQMSRLVMQEVTDPDVLKRIRDRWLAEVRVEKPK